MGVRNWKNAELGKVSSAVNGFFKMATFRAGLPDFLKPRPTPENVLGDFTAGQNVKTGLLGGLKGGMGAAIKGGMIALPLYFAAKTLFGENKGTGKP